MRKKENGFQVGLKILIKEASNMKVKHDKKQTNNTLKRRTKNVLDNLEVIRRLKHDTWEKDLNFFNSCEKLINSKTKEVFKDIKSKNYEL